MKIRFQADADLNLVILLAAVRREPGMDFQTAQAAKLRSLSDPEVLAVASKEGRVLVTHDQQTMPGHFGEYILTQTSSGVIVIPQHLQIAEAVENLLLIWFASEAQEWVNRICYLPL